MARKAKKPQQLFQVFSTEFNTEQFCFHAIDKEDAEHKMFGWLMRHGFHRSGIKENYQLNQVNTPIYANNIHDEWV